MTRSLHLWALATGLALALPVHAAFAADSTIKVSLWDKGPDSMVMDDAHMAMTGMMDMANMSTGTMGITADVAEVPAGNVTFAVTNDSKDIIHEMILARVAAGMTELPYLKDEMRVDEETTDHLGEVSELDPGKAGSLTVDLTAGTYIIYCNIPGHFVDGMWTLITVK